MDKKERSYITLAKLSPKRYREFIEEQLSYSGHNATAENYLGPVNLLAILAFIAIAIIPPAVKHSFNPVFLIYALVAVGMIQLVAYLIIFYSIEERKKQVERVLPDMLYLAAANLKAGMSPYQALKLSAREEFGPLKEEIDLATAKSHGMESFTDALMAINSRIKSEILDRALKLFTTAVKAGGHMAPLLEELANDISETKALKRELVTSTKTYTMFVMFIVIIGTPLLMAISIHFVDVITGIQAKTTSSADAYGLGLFAGEIVITTDFLTKIALVMLTATGILASMLIGTIKEGKTIYGLRYAPFVTIACLIIFYIVRYGVGSFFG